jgi:hypothetical protein
MPRSVITGKDKFSSRTKPKQDLPELHYEADEDTVPTNQQKWKIPKEGLEQLILKAARPMVAKPKYTSHEEKKAVQDIARAALSLQAGVVSVYPLEWVEFCLEFCRKQWRGGHAMPLDNLIKYINNVDKMNDWVAEYASRNHISLQITKQVGDETSSNV